MIVFGDPNSEAAHGLVGSGGTRSLTSGGLRGQPYRSLPLNASLRFSLAVPMDAAAQYLTVELSGEEWNSSADIRACWLVDPDSMAPWPNPGGQTRTPRRLGRGALARGLAAR